MENWGLVTYRETALLVDPQNTSSGTKQWVAIVVGMSREKPGFKSFMPGLFFDFYEIYTKGRHY